jgi:hypothetical protein
MVYYSNFKEFESNIPISKIQDFEKRMGIGNDIFYILINQHEMDKDNIQQFDEKGFNRIENPFSVYELKKELSINIKLNDYVFYNTIRFILLKKMIDQSIIVPPLFIADADVVFFIDPTYLLDMKINCSFFVEGNPGLFFIKTKDSLYQFCHYIRNFFAGEEFNKQRELIDVSDEQIRNVQLDNYSSPDFVYPFRHEQDLLRFLHFFGLIQNASKKEIKKLDVFMCENAINIRRTMAAYDIDIADLTIDKKGRFSMNGKIMPFIHFQDNFAKNFLAWKFLYKIFKPASDWYINLPLLYRIKLGNILSRIKLTSGNRAYSINNLFTVDGREHICDYLNQFAKG